MPMVEEVEWVPLLFVTCCTTRLIKAGCDRSLSLDYYRPGLTGGRHTLTPTTTALVKEDTSITKPTPLYSWQATNSKHHFKS